MASFWDIQRVNSGADLQEDMATYVSQPSEPGRNPAVIVIQEVFGVDAHIQSVADRLAEAGFFAVAPALFHREGNSEAVRGTNPLFSYTGEDADARSSAVGNWKDSQLILDINTTIRWLSTHPRVVGDKIGIVGFCAGGRITYLAAAGCPGLSAAVDYYGGNLFRVWGEAPTPFDRTKDIRCPLMGNFGAEDQNPTVDEVGQIEAALKQHGKTYDFKIHPGAGHGFNCDARASYNQAAAEDAWARTLGWFRQHLG